MLARGFLSSPHKPGNVAPLVASKGDAMSAAEPVTTEVGAGTSYFSSRFLASISQVVPRSFFSTQIATNSIMPVSSRRDSDSSSEGKATTDTSSSHSDDESNPTHFHEESLAEYWKPIIPTNHIYYFNYLSGLLNLCHEYILRYLPFSNAKDKKYYEQNLVTRFRKARFYIHEFAKCDLPSSVRVIKESKNLNTKTTIIASYKKELESLYDDLVTEAGIPPANAEGDISALMLRMYAMTLNQLLWLHLYGDLADDLTTSFFPNLNKSALPYHNEIIEWEKNLRETSLSHLKENALFRCRIDPKSDGNEAVVGFILKMITAVQKIESYCSKKSFDKLRAHRKINTEADNTISPKVDCDEASPEKLEKAFDRLEKKALRLVEKLIENEDFSVLNIKNNKDKNDELIRFLISSPKTDEDLFLLLAQHGYCAYHKIPETTFYDQLLESPAFAHPSIVEYFNTPTDESLSAAKSALEDPYADNEDDERSSNNDSESNEDDDEHSDDCSSSGSSRSASPFR